MTSDHGLSRSYWMEGTNPEKTGPLQHNLRTQVCVVGGGISGLTTAYLLARAGKTVAVLEDGAFGGGVTSLTTGHLSNALDDYFYNIERVHGAEGARLAGESHAAAIRRIESLIAEEGIACDFERLPAYLFTPLKEPAQTVDDELEAAHRAGLEGVERLDRLPAVGFKTKACLRFPDQAQFHPLKYVSGLVRALRQRKVRLYSGTRVAEIQGGPYAAVRTSQGFVVACQSIVLATNAPIADRILSSKQSAYRTYVVAGRVAKGAVARALYYDTLDPYHYVRIHPGRDADTLIVGGEDHKTGQEPRPEAAYGRLARWTRRHFPAFTRVEHRWSGQVLEPMDYMAFIGRKPMEEPNVYVVTGDSGNGLTHGTLGAMLLCDLIAGKPNPWSSLYDPSRIRLKGVKELVRESANVAAQYGQWLLPGTADSVDRIAPGTGAVVRSGLKKLAAYKDESGAVHARSAVCPHMGCIVAWNGAEKTWDCPCHGSRFGAADGNVLNGPASRGLDETGGAARPDGALRRGVKIRAQ